MPDLLLQRVKRDVPNAAARSLSHGQARGFVDRITQTCSA
jgi:hypothetical protein